MNIPWRKVLRSIGETLISIAISKASEKIGKK